MESLLWVGALGLSAVVGLASGISVLAVMILVACAIMLRRELRESADILDPRAGFFLAVLLFIAIPNVVLAGEFGRTGFVWQVEGIPNLVVSRADYDYAQLIVAVGLATVIATVLFLPRLAAESIPPEPARTGRAVWMTYGGALAISTALAVLQYGSPLGMLLYAIDPQKRLEADTGGSGVAGIFILILAVSAYYICRRMRRPWAGLPLFLPALAFVLPMANRGSVVQVLLIAATAATGLRVRRPVLILGLAVLLLPPFAGVLVLARNNAFGASVDWSVGGMYRGFADESSMIPVFAATLGALRSGTIHHTYGLDLLMVPLWYVPRALWAGKPMPLDFRLNAALGLNDGVAFGTPVSIFGGFFVNFTWLAYVPALVAFTWAVDRAFRRIRRDRLVALLLFTFVIDIVRVGDISREIVTFSLGIIAVWIVRRLAGTADAHAPVLGTTPTAAAAF